MRISDWSSDVCSSDLIFWLIAPHWASMSSVIGLAENLRMEMAVPRRDSGGTMTLTRLPSGRRASASGVVWSTRRSEEHTSELQSLMRISYAVFCLKKKNNNIHSTHSRRQQHHRATH